MKSNQFEGLNGAGLKVAVVTARFNQVLTDAMLEDCLKALETAQVAKEDIVSV
ncbi:6,7-dimethyl-8-ribityllumazine synthase, partial [Candidatus Uhrbacteria bacterium]|nr:6,7-dimethyl-8-ribityllumazine synthase [Candidatus Uhrbacteria bacterium]